MHGSTASMLGSIRRISGPCGGSLAKIPSLSNETDLTLAGKRIHATLTSLSKRLPQLKSGACTLRALCGMSRLCVPVVTVAIGWLPAGGGNHMAAVLDDIVARMAKRKQSGVPRGPSFIKLKRETS